ncbi:MAG: L,D-transpeptidase [Opitutaceae bacterium]
MDSPIEQANKTCLRLGIKPATRIIIVRLGPSTLQFFNQGKLVKGYAISTSKRPPSNVKDSLGTPRGLHEIAERIGDGQPPGVVFKSRVPTGKHFSEFPDADTATNFITTRILWLRGLEPGVNQGGNVDTHARFIYIHGTNHEDRIGEQMSSGCVLMRNTEIIELYEQVRSGDQVLITD